MTWERVTSGRQTVYWRGYFGELGASVSRTRFGMRWKVWNRKHWSPGRELGQGDENTRQQAQRAAENFIHEMTKGTS